MCQTRIQVTDWYTRQAVLVEVLFSEGKQADGHQRVICSKKNYQEGRQTEGEALFRAIINANKVAFGQS